MTNKPHDYLSRAGVTKSVSKRMEGNAKTANIEGNESAAYEKLEKKTTKSLKGGGTEKELRAGHNTGVKDTMAEFKSGKLHSGSKSGPTVTNRKQAIAIGLSEARKAGAKVPPKPKKKAY